MNLLKKYTKAKVYTVASALVFGTALTVAVTVAAVNGTGNEVDISATAKEADACDIKNAGIASFMASFSENSEEEQATASKEKLDMILNLKPQTSADENNAAVKTDKKNTVNKKKQNNKVSFAGYKNLGVANVTNYLNVRKEPSLEGKILGKLPMNAGCEILKTLDGWYKIKSGDVTGYVSAEFLLTGDKALKRAKKEIATTATVTCDQLKVRKRPNTNCEVITRVAEGERLEVIKVQKGWVKININNCIGYVCADYVDVADTLPVGVTLAQLSYDGGVSNTVVDVLEYAKQFLGNPYVYGGTSLTNGTDCSGFTMRIYEHFGYYLNRSSASQTANGTPVDLSQIQPGDLLFYSYGGRIGHVAIYMGGGQIIHASTERTGITIGNAFYQTPTCARRIIQ